MSIEQNLQSIKSSIPAEVTLVAVSKTKPNSAIEEAYNAGQRIFGENKVQELTEKSETLPADIEWHMIGHLQSNKVKYIAPFVHLIHAVDSLKLIKEINKRAQQNNRVIQVLLQVHIAQEESKFGYSYSELEELFNTQAFDNFNHIKITGLMGMATNTADTAQVEKEFKGLKNYFDACAQNYQTANIDLKVLSMGMSNDYELAIACGSNMIRVGSSIFGARNYNKSI